MRLNNGIPDDTEWLKRYPKVFKILGPWIAARTKGILNITKVGPYSRSLPQIQQSLDLHKDPCQQTNYVYAWRVR